MGGSIFLRQGDKLVEMKEVPYDAENVLQKLIADHPALLAGEQMDGAAARRWLLVSQQMGVPKEDDGARHWALDALFLDQDGVPTLVEVKRSVNREIRRQIVGQMLDYAANGVAHWTVEKIQATWQEALGDQSPDDVLEELLQDEEKTSDEFWDMVKTNLEAGKVRMVFVADAIPPELLRIVQFLSRQMNQAQVFALEVRQYEGEGQTTLVPRIVGKEVKPRPGGEPPRDWDKDSFLKEISESDHPLVEKILTWAANQHLNVFYGGQLKEGRLYVTDDRRVEEEQKPFYFFRIGTKKGVHVPFKRYRQRPPFDQEAKPEALRARLKAIGITLSPVQHYPGFRLVELKNEHVLEQFLAVISSVRQEMVPN